MERAFPSDAVENNIRGCPMGMTMRQFYAAMSLNGIINLVTEAAKRGIPSIDENKIANFCFLVADAMIKYEKEEGNGI